MVIIQSVTVIRSLVCLTTDRGEKIYLSRKSVSDAGLYEGMEWSDEAFSQFVLTRQYRPALDRAVAMLARRPCSEGEIRQKLRQIRYAQETIDMVVYKLQREHLLNDADFSDQWAAYRVNHQYGSRRIAQELRMKGVSEQDIRNALESLPEEEERDQALHLALKLSRRTGGKEDPRKARQRLISALVRRGYDWDIARSVCEEVLQADEPFDD